MPLVLDIILTRMMREDEVTSSDMSEITLVDSSDLLALPTEWTNEKHCLYLKSMEASFVNELHCSMGLLKAGLHKHALKKQSSRQIIALRDDGSWKYGSKSVTINKSRSRGAKRRIGHYRCTHKSQVLGATVARENIDGNPDEEFESKLKPFLGFDCNSEQLATTISGLRRKCVVGSNTEMMGQNFDGNGQVIGSNLRKAGRKKTETTSNDDTAQVVSVSILKETR